MKIEQRANISVDRMAWRVVSAIANGNEEKVPLVKSWLALAYLRGYRACRADERKAVRK